MTAMLCIDELSVTYHPDQWNENRVLQHVNMELNVGDLLQITGENGSGKSTLLKALIGDVESESITGKVTLNGKDVLAMGSLEKAGVIAMIDQNPALGTCDHLRVIEQLQLCGRDISKRIFCRLEESHSNIQPEQRILDLSGGQRQLLTSLMAIERRPALLLADEATASLDVNFAPIIAQLIAERYGQSGMATIVVTHQEYIASAQPLLRKAHVEDHRFCWVE